MNKKIVIAIVLTVSLLSILVISVASAFAKVPFTGLACFPCAAMLIALMMDEKLMAKKKWYKPLYMSLTVINLLAGAGFVLIKLL